MGHLLILNHTLTHHTRKPLVYSPRLHLYVFQSPTQPVYEGRVDPSTLDFSLTSHRYSHIGLLFRSHFIT
jgi:hypothetical protein